MITHLHAQAEAEALSGSQLLKVAGLLLLVSTAVTAITLGREAGR
jgi:hypothetical protein